MLDRILAPHLGAHLEEVTHLLSLPLVELKTDQHYAYLLDQINATGLEQTLEDARQILDEGIPRLVEDIKRKHHIVDFPLTPYMLTNWIAGYAVYPDQIWELTTTHIAVPKHIMREVVPEVLPMFGDMKAGSAMWQRAFSTLVIPLLAES